MMTIMMLRTGAVAFALCIAACAATPEPAPTTLFGTLRTLCGQHLAGRLESTEAVDADFAGKTLVAGAVACPAPDTVRIPFAVGEDRSRTWVVTRLADGRLRLKHEHRHADGTEDALSQYGGETVAPDAALRADFPADDFSKALFARENRPASIANIWRLEIDPGRTLAYELNRPGRHFRVAFDLANRAT